jgi:hypothetical protein
MMKVMYPAVSLNPSTTHGLISLLRMRGETSSTHILKSPRIWHPKQNPIEIDHGKATRRSYCNASGELPLSTIPLNCTLSVIVADSKQLVKTSPSHGKTQSNARPSCTQLPLTSIAFTGRASLKAKIWNWLRSAILGCVKMRVDCRLLIPHWPPESAATLYGLIHQESRILITNRKTLDYHRAKPEEGKWRQEQNYGG